MAETPRQAPLGFKSNINRPASVRSRGRKNTDVAGPSHDAAGLYHLVHYRVNIYNPFVTAQ